ncbi:MAG TPA: hypothetical protein VNW99_08405 [Cytophagaceae bacterium]|nr:hypothetical protein [Cytophagaceae bacterium]
MISIFRIFEPFRIGVLFLFLIIIKLPMLINGVPLILPELSWMLVAERMNEGFVLYKDIWVTLEPFSAGTYLLLYKLAGNSQLSYQICSLLFVFIQAILLNMVLNINNAYPEKTLIPALLYIIFSSIFFDFMTLSPPLMGATFVIIALHYVFLQTRAGGNDENMFYTGLFIGIASLFYLPYFVFMIFSIFSFVLYVGPGLRKYLIMILGFLLPFLIIGVYYFCLDGLGSLYHNFIISLFLGLKNKLISNSAMLVLLMIPGLLFAVAVFYVSARAKYTNYQFNCFRIMGLWLGFGIISVLLSITISPYLLMMLVPGLAYFCTNFFLLAKHSIIEESVFWATTLLMLLVSYGVLYGIGFKKSPIAFESMKVKEAASVAPAEQINDSKILVLGDNPSLYRNNKIATPYYNWTLSRRHFSDLDNYKTLSNIYSNFLKDMPDVIIDEHGVGDYLFYRIPILGKEYQKAGNLYIRRH